MPTTMAPPSPISPLPNGVYLQCKQMGRGSPIALPRSGP
jgi:hypothetical protein